MQKAGVIWRQRRGDFEISLAEERGCRTYACAEEVFEQMTSCDVSEGCYVTVNFCPDSHKIVKIMPTKFHGKVQKWSQRYAFVQACQVPQIKMGRNKRVSEFKLSKTPQNIHFAPDELEFKVENNERVDFQICVDLSETRKSGTNSFLELIPKNIQISAEHPDLPLESESRAPKDKTLSSWFDRRMSNGSNKKAASPRFAREELDKHPLPYKRSWKPRHISEDEIEHKGILSPRNIDLNNANTAPAASPKVYLNSKLPKFRKSPPGFFIGEIDEENKEYDDLQLELQSKDLENQRLKKEIEKLSIRLKHTNIQEQENEPPTFINKSPLESNTYDDHFITYPHLKPIDTCYSKSLFNHSDPSSFIYGRPMSSTSTRSEKAFDFPTYPNEHSYRSRTRRSRNFSTKNYRSYLQPEDLSPRDSFYFDHAYGRQAYV